MILPINPPKEVTITPAIPAVVVTASEVTILNILDDTVSTVVASVDVDGYLINLTLWDSDTIPTYQQIGNWTQEQANARILELI